MKMIMDDIHNNREPLLFKVSAIQPVLDRHDREGNLERILRMLRQEARENRPHFICIPNYFFQRGLEPLPGPSTMPLREIARESELYIIGGMAETGRTPGDPGHNTGFLVTPRGEMLHFCRKIHMIPMEQGKLAGGCKMAPLRAGPVTVGCVLCNDIFYPEVARCLALSGAMILFVPSIIGGLGVRGLQTICRARAIENQVFVVNANGIPRQAKEENPDLTMGGSGIYSPFLDEIDLATAGSAEETIRGIIDIEELMELRSRHGPQGTDHGGLAQGRGFNMMAGRKPRLYGKLTEPVVKSSR